MSAPASPFTVQLVASQATVDALSEAAAQATIEVRPARLSKADQQLAIAELAAILAVVKTGAEIIQLLIEAYKKAREPQRVTVKTPKGSITLEIDETVNAEALADRLKDAGIVSR